LSIAFGTVGAFLEKGSSVVAVVTSKEKKSLEE
jgi:hypothetical protein